MDIQSNSCPRILLSNIFEENERQYVTARDARIFLWNSFLPVVIDHIERCCKIEGREVGGREMKIKF